MDRENPREIQDRLGAGGVLILGLTDYETRVSNSCGVLYIQKRPSPHRENNGNC